MEAGLRRGVDDADDIEVVAADGVGVQTVAERLVGLYAIVDAAMLRPLPVPDAKRVFTLAAPALEPGPTPGSGETESFSYPLYLQFRAAAGDSARLVVFGPMDRAEVQGPDPTAPIERVRQQFVSGEAREMLRVAPASGRLFSRDDDRATGLPCTAVLSFDYWRRRFNGDPGVVGQSVTLNGRPCQIVHAERPGTYACRLSMRAIAAHRPLARSWRQITKRR